MPVDPKLWHLDTQSGTGERILRLTPDGEERAAQVGSQLPAVLAQALLAIPGDGVHILLRHGSRLTLSPWGEQYGRYALELRDRGLLERHEHPTPGDYVRLTERGRAAVRDMHDERTNLLRRIAREQGFDWYLQGNLMPTRHNPSTPRGYTARTTPTRRNGVYDPRRRSRP